MIRTIAQEQASGIAAYPAMPNANTILAAILIDPGRVRELGASEAAVLLAEVAAVQAALAARIAAQPQPAPEAQRNGRPEEDRLLTVDETASRLSVTPQWLYRHAKQLPFTRKLSRKALRFSENGLRRWQASRTP